MKAFRNRLSIFCMATMALFAGCAPQEWDDYGLTDTGTLTADQISLALTPNSADQWTYDYAVNIVDGSKYLYKYEVSFGDGTKAPAKTPNGTHEYIIAAGTYTAVLSVSLPTGETLTKEVSVVINETNPKSLVDDPASVVYALTGGKENTAGKTWTLKSGSGIGPVGGTWGEWWDFGGNADLFDDTFTFRPNSVQRNGAYVYDNNGGTFCNESCAGLFPDGDPSGSFVTTHYTPSSDAVWTIDTRSGKDYLVITKGFIGYPVQPGDISRAEYEILSFSLTDITLKYYSPDGNAWFFFLKSDVSADPLYGTGSKVWIVDAQNTKAAEIAAATNKQVKGHIGLGPLNSYGQEWWGAGANDKSAWKLYQWELEFTPSTLKITSAGEGYGRKAFDGNPFTSIAVDGDDITFVYNGGSYTYSKTDASPYPKITLSGDAFTGYYVGTQEYEILYLSDDAMALAAHNTVEGQDWVFVFIPKP
jgi:hypothetical protein